MAEIFVISLVVMVIGIVLSWLLPRLGELDDVPTMRDMVRRS